MLSNKKYVLLLLVCFFFVRNLLCKSDYELKWKLVM